MKYNYSLNLKVVQTCSVVDSPFLPPPSLLFSPSLSFSWYGKPVFCCILITLTHWQLFMSERCTLGGFFPHSVEMDVIIIPFPSQSWLCVLFPLPYPTSAQPLHTTPHLHHNHRRGRKTNRIVSQCFVWVGLIWIGHSVVTFITFLFCMSHFILHRPGLIWNTVSSLQCGMVLLTPRLRMVKKQKKTVCTHTHMHTCAHTHIHSHARTHIRAHTQTQNK